MNDSWSCRSVVFLATVLFFPALRPADAADPLVADTPEAAAADPDFSLQGEYTGENVAFQVVALGEGQFQIVKFAGGLPGAGWNGKDRQVDEDDADAIRALIESQGLKRIERASPTLGAKPPADAIVLFDGTQASLDEHWGEGTKMTPDALLIPEAKSKDTFTDYSLHIEFRLPYMPQARGQGRGNSGVYYQGRYETQVLDSFGLEGKNNECGGLYTIRDPDLNMCLPPLTWQTYDCDFTAARWDAEGKKTANARITVKLNGVTVHQDAELPGPTTAAPFAESQEPGPVYLQDHGNPVRYRNIWVVPRNAELEALRPIVPAFERFAAGRQGAEAQAGGQLLLTELGCANCHTATDTGAPLPLARPAPILEGLGERAHADWLYQFIRAPHTVKPGTTMPEMFGGLSDAQRNHEVTALVSYLVDVATPKERAGDRAASQRGAQLYREIGCVACHDPQPGDDELVANRSTTIPLPELRSKYTTVSLAKFLKNPHEIRPAGRMPSFGLDDRDARDLACFLIGDPLSLGEPNVHFAAYESSGDKLPDFDSLTADKTGTSRGFDLSVAGRENNFAVRYEGYWNITKTGQFRFFLGSDDGSRLWIDDIEVVNNDGVHPHTENTGRAQLDAGVHKVRVEYFQGGGEWTLTLDFDGNGFSRQTLEPFLHLTREDAVAPPKSVEVAADDGNRFHFDAALRDEGRELFMVRGCAACHRVTEGGAPLASKRSAKPLSELDATRGCLVAAAPTSGSEPSVPRFDLNPTQRFAIQAALKAGATLGAEPGALLAATMAEFNCYACHRRSGIGGPSRDRDPLFLTSIQEMGDEGRVPPPLDGVGDKLRPDWLKHVLQEGAKDRPYMKTRMPKFGSLPVDQIVDSFVSLDQHNSGVKPPEFDEPSHRVKATGRKLAGNLGLACVKCHVFDRYPASGIQSIDLTKITRRVREDWFMRYLVNPQAYRPGTRMPTAFVDGVSAVHDIYEGDPARQMAALWTYLSDGAKAGVPEGVEGESIELKPTDSPILYRNFLAGLSPRGIAVGFPEKAHLAWDAEKMCLALVWHGRFIDAGKHWTGRGDGAQSPLGDHIMRIDQTVPLARLESLDTPWPDALPRNSGYAFRGYRLDAEQRPTFRYDLLKSAVKVAEPLPEALVHVEDTPIPAVDIGISGEPGFRRSLVLTADQEVDNLYLRIAAGSVIEPTDQPGEFLIDGEWHVRLAETSVQPLIRTSKDRKELLVPVTFAEGRAELVEEIRW